VQGQLQEINNMSADDFFAGGLPSAKFDTQGTVIGGRIVRVGDPMQQRDMDGNPKFWDAEKREPMMQLPIDVETDLRDPEVIGDTGARTLYVKGDMKRAIGEALRRAGVQGAPKVGGTLEVAWTGTEPAKKRGFNDKKVYTARYTPPAAGDAFFGGQSSEFHRDSAGKLAPTGGGAANVVPQPAAPVDPWSRPQQPVGVGAQAEAPPF
jgi:hypothetical protein